MFTLLVCRLWCCLPNFLAKLCNIATATSYFCNISVRMPSVLSALFFNIIFNAASTFSFIIIFPNHKLQVDLLVLYGIMMVYFFLINIIQHCLVFPIQGWNFYFSYVSFGNRSCCSSIFWFYFFVCIVRVVLSYYEAHLKFWCHSIIDSLSLVSQCFSFLLNVSEKFWVFKYWFCFFNLCKYFLLSYCLSIAILLSLSNGANWFCRHPLNYVGIVSKSYFLIVITGLLFFPTLAWIFLHTNSWKSVPLPVTSFVCWCYWVCPSFLFSTLSEMLIYSSNLFCLKTIFEIDWWSNRI